jgi:hypothetical protein
MRTIRILCNFDSYKAVILYCMNAMKLSFELNKTDFFCMWGGLLGSSYFYGANKNQIITLSIIGFVIFLIGSVLGYILVDFKRARSQNKLCSNAAIGPINFEKDLFVTETVLPPKGAEALLMVVARSSLREALVGDMEQRFFENCVKFGLTRANRLYWVETLHSVSPLIWQAAKRLGIAAAAIAGFKKWIGL